MKVVLLGYMTSGKSSVGKQLAVNLKCVFFDLDNEIEKALGMTIPEIFAKKGEVYFRKKESEILNSILEGNSKFVLSLGGGTPCYGRNMELVKKATKDSIYLKVAIASLIDRISQEKNQRPLVAGILDEDLPEFIGKHLFERIPFYTMAENTVETDGKTIREIAQEIEDFLV